MSTLDRALRAFNAQGFVDKHNGHKESRSLLSHEYLLPCHRCGSSRLRWNHPTKQTWVCWGCGRTGSTIDLIAEFEELSYMKAYQFVMDAYNGGDADWTVKPIEEAAARPQIMPIEWPRGVQVLSPCAAHAQGWNYLRYRGVTPEQAAQYQIAFGVGGKLRNYLVFPVYMHGHLVYWQGRATWDPPAHLESEARKAWIRDTQYRKTLNPLKQANTLGGGEILFNYDQAYTYDYVVVNEGPIDVVKVGPFAVGLFGKVAQSAKVHWLRAMPARTKVVYLDRGAEERENAMALCAALEGSCERVLFAEPPEGHDPGGLTPEQNRAVLSQARPISSVSVYASKLGRL